MQAAYAGFSYPETHGHRPLKRRRFKVAEHIHVFTGYGASSISLIIGRDGYSLVDTGDGLASAGAVLAEIRQLTGLPLRNIFLTHSHPDHRGGGEVFLKEAPEAAVWARKNFGAEQAGFKGLENISAVRGRRQFGLDIPGDVYTPNTLIPLPGSDRPGTLITPNRLVDEPVQILDCGGVRVELHAISSETPDHLLVWLPEERVLFCGDTMYRSFPNLYPVRGSGYRDVAAWAAAVRRLLDFEARVLVMGHNEPAFDAEVRPMIENYAAALQYIYDETVKGMNAGRTPDELAALVRLPEELRRLPYLAELYGAVPWAVRSIFSGLLGWFDGNASRLVPLTPVEEARRMAELAGGQDKLLDKARAAQKAGDFRWACQLADYLLHLGPECPIDVAVEARSVKADALEALSRIVLPMSGKNYLLSSALELRKK